MRAAITVWQGRVAPVFDVSREALVLTIENGVVTSRSSANIETPMASLKLDRLTELGIEILVCGAITEPLMHELSLRGVRVICFVAGEVEEVEKSLLDGRLPKPALSMPGCYSGRKRLRGGCGRGGWRRGGRGPKERP